MKMRWKRHHEHEAAVRRLWESRGAGEFTPKVFYGYDLTGREVLHALVGREPVAPGDDRWHISLSAAGRVPTWDELANAAHELRPGVAFVAGVPPRSWWINIHEHVLHLWETTDANLLAQWRSERRGDTQTSGEAA
jgi:hypothetical protein